jgi:NAD+ synthase (glutamine-hydrolysing)
VKIAMAQMNPVVGDISGNFQRIKELWISCDQQETDLLLLPELFLVGYPPRDLLERPAFLDRVNAAIDEMVALSLVYKRTCIL